MANLRKIARQKALKYGLDPDIYVRQIGAESNFNPNAVSPAGALGIAQIMPATAQGWGVNPHDPVASLDVAAKNMAEYVRKYGSYRNALVAYNAGPGRVGGSLPTETQNYIAKILGGQDPGRLSAPKTTPAPAPAAPMPLQPVQKNVLDQAGYEQAKRKSLIGGLLAKNHGTNSILFRSGLLTTTAPDPKDFMRTVLTSRGASPGAAPRPTGGQVGKTLVIGDSLGVGTLPFLERMVGSKKITANVLGGRPSSHGVEVLRKLIGGGGYQNVVFDLGTNDATVDELRKSLRMLNRLAPDVNIVIPTINSPFQPGAKNALLRTFAKNHPNVQLVGWRANSAGNLAGDGIHATTSGYQARARLIAQALGWQGGQGAAAAHGDGRFKITGANPGRLTPQLVAFARKVAGVYGKPLTGDSGATHSKLTVNGNVSDHWSGNATDIPASGATLLALGRAALIAAGMPKAQAMKQTGGLFNVGRHQIIFLTNEGGNHYDHLHISV